MQPADFKRAVEAVVQRRRKGGKARPPRPRLMGYREALDWILTNDDCVWLDDPDPIASVTAVFVADLFDRPSTEAVVADLLRRRAKAKE